MLCFHNFAMIPTCTYHHVSTKVPPSISVSKLFHNAIDSTKFTHLMFAYLTSSAFTESVAKPHVNI